MEKRVFKSPATLHSCHGRNQVHMSRNRTTLGKGNKYVLLPFNLMRCIALYPIRAPIDISTTSSRFRNVYQIFLYLKLPYIEREQGRGKTRSNDTIIALDQTAHIGDKFCRQAQVRS